MPILEDQQSPDIGGDPIVVVKLRMTRSLRDRLDDLQRTGGYPTRNALILHLLNLDHGHADHALDVLLGRIEARLATALRRSPKGLPLAEVRRLRRQIEHDLGRRLDDAHVAPEI